MNTEPTIHEGKLSNGVTWRLSPLRPEQERYAFLSKHGYRHLTFDDPCAKPIVVPSSMLVDKEQWYREQLQEHIRLLKLRGLVPAEPGDPDGFFVKWESRAKE